MKQILHKFGRSLAVFLSLGVILVACELHEPEQYNLSEAFTIDEITIDDVLVKGSVLQILQSLTLHNGRILVDVEKMPELIDDGDFTSYIEDLNQWISTSRIILNNPQDVRSVIYHPDAPKFMIDLDRELYAEDTMDMQAAGVGSCYNVHIHHPHSSHYEPNVIKVKASGYCTFSSSYPASTTLDLRLQRKSGWGIFGSWSTISNGFFTRHGPQPTWSDSTTVVRSIPCVSGEYRGEGYFTFSGDWSPAFRWSSPVTINCS
jgi:hypothetical protein